MKSEWQKQKKEKVQRKKKKIFRKLTVEEEIEITRMIEKKNRKKRKI